MFNLSKNEAQEKVLSILSPPSSLSSLLKSIHKKPHKIQQAYQVLYDDNKIPVQQHFMNDIPSDKEIQLFDWRNQTSASIVKLQHITFQSIKEGAKFRKGSVLFTDHVVRNFKQLADLPLSGMIYLFKESLLGFEEIHRKLGEIVVKAELCGIDVVGRCKVWINHNFSSNEIEKNVGSRFYVKSEKEIIHRCFDIIRMTKFRHDSHCLRFLSQVNEYIMSQK
mgnify:CR=1 FL=1